jgi:hypothetical protein
MKKRTSIHWGKWLREGKREKWIVAEIQKISKLSKLWAAAAIIITILLVSTGVLLNYFVGLRSSEKIDESTRQLLNITDQSIRQALNAINPNDFLFKPFENSQWYTPTPVKEYVKLNILPRKSRKIALNFIIKNNSEFLAENVYCMILFSNKEFVESGDDIVKRLKGLDGLNVYAIDSSDDYLNEAAAFEWISIPPKTQKTVSRQVELTLKGNTGRLTVRINSVNRFVFEFRLHETN